MESIGDFDKDVRAGYYKNCSDDFYDDFLDYLRNEGVPEKYVRKVASYAWQHGHSSGEIEVLNVSYDLVEIFK